MSAPTPPKKKKGAKKGVAKKKVPAALDQPTGPLTATVQGLEVTFDPGALDDVEMFDMLNELSGDVGQAAMVPKVLHSMFGDQYPKVMNHLRGANGRVSFETASQFMADALGQVNPN